MASKTKKIIAVSLLLLVAILVAAALYARWYVTSGRLRILVEKRAGEAVNANVRIKSLRPAWPPRIEIEGVVVSAPGHEDTPLITCPRITITGAAWELARGHVGSIVLVSPRINLFKTEDGASNIPAFPAGGGGSTSFGIIKILDARIDLDLPEAKISTRGILVTLSARRTAAGMEEILKLDVDAVDVSLSRGDEEPVPIGLRMIQSKFVRRGKSAGYEIEGEINAGLRMKAPYLSLPPNVPIRLSFEFDHFPQRDSLENGIFTLGALSSLRARVYGSVTGLTSGEPSPNLKVTVSPLDIATLAEYVEPLRRPMFEDASMSGNLHISGDIAGNLSDPEVSVRISAEQGRIEWKGFSLEGIEVEAPLTLKGETIAFEAGRVGIAKTIVPVGEDFLEITSLNGIVSGDAAKVKIEDATAGLGGAGEVAFRVAYEPGSGLLSANVRMTDASVADALAYASPAIGTLPDDVSVSGRFSLEIDVDAKAGAGLETLGAEYRVSLSAGEITSGELIAVAGIDAGVNGTIGTESPGELWKFDASGHAGGFELLVDTFYKDFSDSRFPFSLSGEYAVKPGRVQGAKASLDLGPTGTIDASGDASIAAPPEIAARLESERIDLGALFEWIGGELLAETAPDLDVASIGGIASGNVDVGLHDRQWTVGGRLRLDDGGIELDGGALGMDSLSIDLPFSVYFPQEESHDPVDFTPEDYGSVKIRGLGVGPVDIASLDLAVALKKNALSVRGPTSVEVFGGGVTIGAIEGENLFGPGAAMATSISVREISLEKITEALELPEVVGTVEADFPEIILTTETLIADGAARTTAFGGTIDVTSLEVAKPVSSVRTLMADIKMTGIDLSTVTDVLDFGSITGIMDGTLTGFEMSQGQPSAFVADFQTVKRRGVRQRINVAAVENITILGTGQGFKLSLGRGLASFFDEFGYDSIGFFCTLKNDNFMMSGKTIRGDTEYFVKGVTFGPQINVINRNRGQTVSFKSMLERVNRIGGESADEEW